jgi:hypothetical protein
MASGVGISQGGGSNEKDVPVSPLGEAMALVQRIDVRDIVADRHESALRH